jgi:Tfp pilus assembly ATPase PilU
MALIHTAWSENNGSIIMIINKGKIIKNICYTELVYGRINKKLKYNLTKEQTEKYIFRIIKETEEKNFKKTGKNIYITNKQNKVRITVNSYTFRIITADRIKD